MEISRHGYSIRLEMVALVAERGLGTVLCCVSFMFDALSVKHEAYCGAVWSMQYGFMLDLGFFPLRKAPGKPSRPRVLSLEIDLGEV